MIAPADVIKLLQEVCGYSDGTDGNESGVDSLIAYKDALEECLHEALLQAGAWAVVSAKIDDSMSASAVFTAVLKERALLLEHHASRPHEPGGEDRATAHCIECGQPVTYRFGAWHCPVHRDEGHVQFGPPSPTIENQPQGGSS